ncbi:MAG: S41 family peptidase [Chloroflexi bacterium]|nr:S41 family peptidase [Chloroflexota bacterium]
MSKILRYLSIGCLAILLLMGTFSGGLLIGWFIPRNTAVATPPKELPPVVSAEQESVVQAEDDDLFSPFWEAWDIVHEQFVDQPVDDVALMRGAIRGMIDALGDQHSSYMDPDEYRQANMPMDGEYEGIGAWVDTSGEFLTITSPMAGSPAEKAGLRPGDMIIKVDGEDMTGIDSSLVLRRVLGPAGTDVMLTIVREGEPQPFDVTVTRAKIILKSVESKMLDQNIAYVQLTTFGENSTRELRAALRELLKQNPKGLILDLRNNGGGYLNTAIEVVSQFIPEGVVMIERYGDGTEQTYRALSGGLATEIPLVVLINEGTASASEITAGAIQDYGRGTLVGMTSYGKGSVQNWVPLSNDEGAVRVTIARWLTPKGRQIHEVGLEPDIIVELTEEDYEAGRDPQLEKAIEILSK